MKNVKADVFQAPQLEFQQEHGGNLYSLPTIMINQEPIWYEVFRAVEDIIYVEVYDHVAGGVHDFEYDLFDEKD